VAAVTLGGVVAWWSGGLVGVAAGTAVAVTASLWLSRSRSRRLIDRERRRAGELPVAADLLAACVRAGAPPGVALAAVASAVDRTLGDDLAAVAVALQLSGDPIEAWDAVVRRDPVLSPWARAVRRAVVTGTPMADAFDRLASEERAAARTRRLDSARRVGVRAAAPLGLCFLPAFILIAIAPLVLGLVGGLVRGPG
jgi:Flp pilus assembly protein TadB